MWFRRDLRIEDNPALTTAARDGSVVAVFIWCPEEEGQFYPGRVSRWWLKQSLIHLSKTLRSLGVELKVIKTQSTLSTLLECITALGATKLVYNHLYDPVSLVRDHDIKQKLGELGITVKSFNGDLLCEPWEIYDDEGHAITKFDVYWKTCLSMQKEPVMYLPPLQLIPAEGLINCCTIDELGLENELEKSSNALLGRGWSPGWSNADKVFSEFVENHLLDYSKDSHKVAGTSTSLLSPYLHFGELSVRKVYHFVQMKQILWTDEKNLAGAKSAKLYLQSIGLREYSRYICFNFPYTHERSLVGNLKFFPWHADQDLFKAWRQGRTGYPLVDAGMRELWATGWMHNRIRVIVSSFFVKFLMLPWQWGMKYFWDTLLDADLESDILGWQYISGSLPDGHELERLDSPEVQGFKYDPEGEYVRQWLPEFARMPAEWIHHPWEAPPNVLRSAGVELGQNYPRPIVDIDIARDRLTEAICIMRGNEATARAANTNGTNEVVFENSDTNEDFAIPKVVLKEKNSCATISSSDQKVPSMQQVKNGLLSKKRAGPADDVKRHQGKLVQRQNECSISRVHDDLSSTAESSSKRQATSSRTSHSVPQMSNQISSEKSLLGHEYSGMKQQCQEEVDLEEISS